MVKRYFYKLFIFSFLVAGACNQPIPECDKIIDIDPFFKNEKGLRLSEIASNIEYIRLETAPEYLIGRIKKIIFFNGKYLIFDSQTYRILIFNASGKYIIKIEQKGKGPGEYLQISDFTVLPVDSSICLVDDWQVKVIKYDFSGKFLHERRLQALSNNIASLNDSLIVLQFNFPEFVMNDILYWATTGTIRSTAGIGDLFLKN